MQFLLTPAKNDKGSPVQSDKAFGIDSRGRWAISIYPDRLDITIKAE